ncbi:DUF6402 family protein [Variovorax sp. RHLX14]|uniref:DUF6402 family protein n=1 Tax=Variovorax sp. RHLX14 TaxID=1259731 RepID=UPI003F48639E
MVKAIEEKKIAYLKSNNFLRLWSERECEVCEVEGVGLSMARPAPPLLYARPVEVAPERAVKDEPLPKKKVPDDPYLNVFNAILKTADAVADFSDWLKRPPEKMATVAVQKTKALLTPPPSKKVPPFDIQDVPKAMRKLHMPMAAKLQERWFAGQANYSQSPGLLQNEIDQNGLPYSPAMVDSTTIKMSWVLSFPRAKKAFEFLIENRLQTPQALSVLKAALIPYQNRREILGWNIANSDFLSFHQKFQFQLIKVDGTWGQRIAQFLNREATAGGVPDDLTGALGSFNFYVAVRYASFDHAARVASVTDVSIYVRDPYEFSDDQYLGHWSASHVAVVPVHQLQGGEGWLDYPVNDGDITKKDSVLYPVTNRHYRDWRTKHARGGDFMIYSDRVNIRLKSPIRVVL